MYNGPILFMVRGGLRHGQRVAMREGVQQACHTRLLRGQSVFVQMIPRPFGLMVILMGIRTLTFFYRSLS